MAALTSERDTLEISNGARTLVIPVKGETTIYQGSIVAIDANGYAVPGKLATALKAAGRAEETVINTGADGEMTIRVCRGVFVFDNETASGETLTAADVMGPCYIKDDHTVTKKADGASLAGMVIRVYEAGVAVEFGSGYAAPVAAAAGGGGGNS